ncbi:hypothetical protein C8R43DRAFT_1127236 [Mycena crocata]|nr:hypothetical protein C8R43DRAFT_965123 [Mycena crocata]KAJ7152154.1 hypothetical protein C8R43DRAFT_1127236 [Mycena crocata]
MTHIPAPAASGTAPAVPVAANGSSADANTVAAIQLLTAAVASLAQAQAPATAVDSPAEASSSPDLVPAIHTPPASSVPVTPAAPAQFHTHGPWVVKNLYIVVPTSPMMAIVEDDEEGKLWYAITRGRFVGITLSSALATNSTTRVPAGTQKGFKTQAAAVAAFNELLGFNMVSVVAP